MTSIDHGQAGEIALANATQGTETLQTASTSSGIGKIANAGANNSDMSSSLGTMLSRLRIVGAALAKAGKQDTVCLSAFTDVPI